MKKDLARTNQQILNNLHQLEDFFFILDNNKKITYVNSSLLEFWKRSLPDVLGKTFADFGYTQDLIKLYDQQLDKALSGKIVTGENEFIGADGLTNYYEYTFVPVIDSHQKVSAIAGTAKNINVRKKIEIQLKQSEQHFRTFAETMPQMAFMADASGEIIYYNQTWYDYVQKDHTEGWGWKERGIHHPEDLLGTLERWDLSLKTGIPYECEYRLRRHDGVYLWHLGRALPLKDESGNILIWVGTNTNIDDQKTRAERMIHDFNNLAHTNQTMHDQKHIRETMIAGISHDLRTPLTSAKINSELLYRKTEDPEMRKIALRITSSMERADRMIRDILDVSRLEAGKKLSMKLENICINSFLEDLVQDYRNIYGDRFRIKIDNSITGYWDEDMLKRIMENLINNALKYGDNHGEINICIEEFESRLEISIHNKGEPIPHNEQLYLFNAFERSQSAKSETTGWGIGLTLVRGLCALMGGKIEVESTKSKGTTFTVCLPLNVSSLAEPL